jgi:hypothetical protein
MAHGSLGSIEVTDALLAPRIERLSTHTLPQQFDQIILTGRLANFRRAAGHEQGPFQGLFFNDSDVYKWLEAAAYALSQRPSADLRRMVDETIDAVVAAQEPDGYLNTYFQLAEPDLKWRNLGSMHEMYCAGHLIEAGVAFAESMGDNRLLAVAQRFADLLVARYGPAGQIGFCGHEEVEFALLRLAAHTEDARYHELAQRMVEARGHRPSPFEAEFADEDAIRLSPHARTLYFRDGAYSGEYAQDHLPIRDHDAVVGHAVRAMYLYMAGTRLADQRKDEPFAAAMERTWATLVGRRMYITGGIGSSSANEGFTHDYDLPNLSAYAETCASVGLVLWGKELLALTGNADYADTIERALLNNCLAGISAEGDRYFYGNPLESRLRHQRTPWFHCACCPPNIARLLGQVGSVLSRSDEAGWCLDIAVAHRAVLTWENAEIGIDVQGSYPFPGPVTVRLSPSAPVRLTVKVRIPQWADEVAFDFPGGPEATFDRGYAVFELALTGVVEWTIDFGMHPKWIEADPRVLDNLGRAALQVGPIVYAAESSMEETSPQRFRVDLREEVTQGEPYMGLPSYRAAGRRVAPDFPDDLYAETGNQQWEPGEIELIPYFAWNHRGPSFMQVWLAAL